MRNLRRLHEAGVTIAAGTDAGNIGTLHGSALYAELETMVEAGLSTKDVLITATLNGAKHMAREHELGTIEAGKLADLVVLDANPLDDIRNVAGVHMVVKDGLGYRPGDLDQDTPEQLAQRHVNAFNAQNATSIAELYAPSAQLDDAGAVVRTPQAIAKYFGAYFARNPDVHAKLTSRTTEGQKVILQAEISQLADGRSERNETQFMVNGSTIVSSTAHPLE